MQLSDKDTTWIDASLVALIRPYAIKTDGMQPGTVVFLPAAKIWLECYDQPIICVWDDQPKREEDLTILRHKSH